ncbi:MAG: bifunctional nicotinamidase/pyrazinamidase [Coriobacteriia bacterium]|nr:bifunctional nicotinamidase/pyrazinamidase [Coriobacteriia bacterium]MBS5478005.1 bifunctional nicotinamidase/pyrazinamidase [Coriobacteriia bacterium]
MKALLIIDVQNDFCPGGTLAVADGDAVVPVANELIAQFAAQGLPIVATQDWHPAGHVSFASAHPGHAIGELLELPGGGAQMLWPDHCVQDTPGAELHPDLDVTRITHVVHKGCDPARDSYSAFFDNDHVSATGLDAWLREHSVDELVVCGLACDYCVKYSVLDALALGYAVSLPRTGTRAVDATPGDGERTLQEMTAKGAHIL